jgi:uncharacterized YccA/Bax inhibitor family protein
MNVLVMLQLLLWYGNPLLLRDSGLHGIIFMNVCIVITVAMVC